MQKFILKTKKKWLTRAGLILYIIFYLSPISSVSQVIEGQLDSNHIKRTILSQNSSTAENNRFTRLQQALLKYRELASDKEWPNIPIGTPLKAGDYGERVALLKKFFIVTGDLSEDVKENEFSFNETIHNSVIKFQKRHGLKVDGIVGPETLRNINVPIEKRIRQMEINLERLEQFQKDFSRRFILVNIAAFELEIVEDEDTLITMKVIVGKQYWNTPVFSSKITYLVVNPSWYVPNSIAVKEILPKIKKDPEYLDTEGLKVYSIIGRSREEIDISTIDWTAITADNFNFRLVQPPGLTNPLGRIKFIFPNRFNVYLHDTPAKVLFEKSSRAFSHGCIRIEKPLELAEYLLRENSSWTTNRIISLINEGNETRVNLPSPVDVHIIYITSWVDKENVLHFRKDIYGSD